MESADTRPRRPPRPPPPSSFNSLNDEAHKFQEHKSAAFNAVNKALSLDEQGQSLEAVSHYRLALQHIQSALSNRATPDNAASREKLNSTKVYVESRLAELTRVSKPEVLTNTGGLHTALPTYEEATSGLASSPTNEDNSLPPYNADVLLEIADAQVFFITAEGYVSTPSYPNTLRVCRFSDCVIAGAPEHFIQVGAWTYPLIRDLTPSLITADGAYIFPDVTSHDEGAAVGVIFPDGQSLSGVFQELLSELRVVTRSGDYHAQAGCETHPCWTAQCPITDRVVQPTPADKDSLSEQSTCSSNRLSLKISQGITTASTWVSWGLEKGTDQASRLLSRGGQKLRQTIDPTAEEKAVDNRTLTGLKMARQATHKLVMVSSYVVTALGEATMALGRTVAPHIKRHANKMLPERLKKPFMERDADSRSKVDDVLEVAGAGIQGFAAVFLSLEHAAKSLGRAIAAETSETVGHKFGNRAGEATHEALYTVGNTLVTAHNISNLGPKAIAKRAVKDTGKALVLGDDNPPHSDASDVFQTNPRSGHSTKDTYREAFDDQNKKS